MFSFEAKSPTGKGQTTRTLACSRSAPARITGFRQGRSASAILLRSTVAGWMVFPIAGCLNSREVTQFGVTQCTLIGSGFYESSCVSASFHAFSRLTFIPHFSGPPFSAIAVTYTETTDRPEFPFGLPPTLCYIPVPFSPVCSGGERQRPSSVPSSSGVRRP